MIRSALDRLGSALSVAVVVGTLAGLIEGIIALGDNAYVSHFALLCLTTPIILTTVWVSGVTVLLTVGLAALRIKRRIPELVGSLLGGIIAMAFAARWWMQLNLRAADDAKVLCRLLAVLVPLAATTAGWGAKKVIHRSAGWGRREWSRLTIAAVLINILAAVPIASTTLTEGRGFLYDSATGQPRQPNELNVLLVTIDTLRADRLGAFGGAPGLTPNLDRLATQAVRFTAAITAAPWTLPAIASLFTGLTPDQHGAGRSLDAFDLLARSPLPPSAWTLASALGRCGFLTQAFVTNPYLSMRYGVGNGFDRFENVSMESEAFVAFADTTAVRLVQALAPRLVIGDIGQTVTDRALPWLARHRDERFFLWVHYVDAHAPYGDPRVLGNKSFRGDTVAAALTDQREQLSRRFDAVARLRSGEIHLTPDQRRQLIRLYDTSVAYDDEQVGQLLDALHRLGLSDHTVVIVVGDHGEEFWDHGGVEHGHTLYEELIRVPLIIRWPGGPTHQRIDSVVRLTDIAPTVLDVTGCRGDMPAMDGRSLRPLIQGDADAPRTSFSEAMLFSDDKHALRTQDFKYVRSANGKEELFDLQDDPRELHDLASQTGAVEEFRRQMDEHLRSANGNRTGSLAQ